MSSVCPFCKKTCLNKYFDEHLRSHTDERPFTCDLCPEKFTTNGNLTKHVDTRHRNKKFKCDDCLSLFTSSHLLSRHKKRAKESKGIKCPKCCIKIIKRGNLNHHLRLAHCLSETELEAFQDYFVEQESQDLEQVNVEASLVNNQLKQVYLSNILNNLVNLYYIVLHELG